ncbi:hypothetical protein P691DRAFT_756701 [Macrolepiota fuliginosa MF-IS2]|uniref:F-box domain-containing protein n=1 Tax=Macrolepiota fuliginosa MF-IS2 TaxID=1400762 RepID=A0A9P5XKI0_9AGAR|nr:hypothetical protein P691DRAFT_756701 [Macrolepiota fuliginosa MF-IS2]
MAILSDLPVEMLEQVLDPLGDTDLLHLAKVNRTLNSLALKEFFKQAKIDYLHGHIYVNKYNEDNPWEYRHLHTSLVLHALCLCLDASIKNITTLSIFLGRAVKMVLEVQHLTRFICQLESLGSLALHITDRDYGSGTPWTKSFGLLFDVAQSKGVDGLHIYELEPQVTPQSLRARSSSQVLEARRELSFLVVSEHFAELWRQLWGSARDDNPNHSSSIRTIRLSSMLLSHVFFRHTIDILRAHKKTICELILDQVAMDWEYWFYLLDELRFPSLKQFTFKSPSIKDSEDPTFPNLRTFVPFLRRHRNITYLDLNHLPQGGSDHWRSLPVMPNLKVLLAHATVAATLLQRPENSRNLEFLELYSQPTLINHSNPMISSCIWGFDLALAAIASNAQLPVKVSLHLETSIDLCGWIGGRASDIRSAGVVRRLTQVHELAILLGRGPLLGMDFLIDVLPKWLGLFPALEDLSLSLYDKGDRSYISAIADSCPRLKSFEVNGVDILPAQG